jgi:amino acid transporter
VRVKAGGGNTGSVFDPHSGNPKGFSSVLPAAIYAMLSFIGFEAAAPIGEESANPRRNIPVAKRIKNPDADHRRDAGIQRGVLEVTS